MIRYFVDESELASFINKILQSEGFRNLEPQFHDAMRGELLSQIENDTASFIADNLNLLDAEALGKLVQQGARIEIQQFIEKKIPDAMKKIGDLLVRFRDFYVPDQDILVQ